MLCWLIGISVRKIDTGRTIEYVSEKRDMEAAKQFFKQTIDVGVHDPERVITDGYDSYPRAIRETIGNDVVHRTNVYLNNR